MHLQVRDNMEIQAKEQALHLGACSDCVLLWWDTAWHVL